MLCIKWKRWGSVNMLKDIKLFNLITILNVAFWCFIRTDYSEICRGEATRFTGFENTHPKQANQLTWLCRVSSRLRLSLWLSNPSACFQWESKNGSVFFKNNLHDLTAYLSTAFSFRLGRTVVLLSFPWLTILHPTRIALFWKIVTEGRTEASCGLPSAE